MMKFSTLLYGLLFFLAGCATYATAYQPDGFTGGYSETQLNENTFKVNFSGNAYTSTERASDFALLRSAELTIKHGYNYFIIVDSQNQTSNSTYTTPKSYKTTLDAFGNARTTSRGGITYQFSYPSSQNTILCFTEKPQVNGIIYDARFIMNEIKSKYEIQQTLD